MGQNPYQPGQDHQPTVPTRTTLRAVTPAVCAPPPQSPLTIDDLALVQKLRAGDGAVFRDFIREYQPPLISLAARFSDNQAMAEDTVQEAWVVALSRLHLYDQEPGFITWITGIVVGVARTKAARIRRMRAFSEAARIDINGEIVGCSFRNRRSYVRVLSPWDHITPESEFGDRQLLQHLNAAINALPPLQRAVVRLRDLEGHGSAAICEMLDISGSNLRVLLHRARVRLRSDIASMVNPPIEPPPIEPPRIGAPTTDPDSD